MSSPIPTQYRIPTSIKTFLVLAFVPLYPAVWNPDRGVRQVASTILVIGLVGALVAMMNTGRTWILDIERRSVERHAEVVGRVAARQMLEVLTIQLAALAEPEWTDLVRRMDSGEYPAVDTSDELRN